MPIWGKQVHFWASTGLLHVRAIPGMETRHSHPQSQPTTKPIFHQSVGAVGLTSLLGGGPDPVLSLGNFCKHCPSAVFTQRAKWCMVAEEGADPGPLSSSGSPTAFQPEHQQQAAPRMIATEVTGTTSQEAPSAPRMPHSSLHLPGMQKAQALSAPGHSNRRNPGKPAQPCAGEDQRWAVTGDPGATWGGFHPLRSLQMWPWGCWLPPHRHHQAPGEQGPSSSPGPSLRAHFYLV